MKKVMLSLAMFAAISLSASLNAQDVKTKTDKAKTESCCKKDAKAEKSGCSTKKTADNDSAKKGCCSVDKASDKKTADAKTSDITAEKKKK